MKKWLTLSFLSLAFFFYMSDRALFGLLVIPIQESTGLSDIQIGLVDTVMFWVYAAVVPFAGILGDFIDRRKLIALSIVLWGAATALTGLVGGFLGFVLVRSVLMTGIQTVYTPAASALIAEEHGKTRGTVAWHWLAGRLLDIRRDYCRRRNLVFRICCVVWQGGARTTGQM